MTSDRGDRLRLTLLLAASVLFHLAVIIAFNSMNQRVHSDRQGASYLLVEQVKLGKTGQGELSTVPAARQSVPAVTEPPRNRPADSLPRSALMPTVPVQNSSQESPFVSRGDGSHPAAAPVSSEQRTAGVATQGYGTTGAAISIRAGQKTGDLPGVSRGNGASPAGETDGSSKRRNTYQALLKSIIEAHKRYPLAARKSGREGTCKRRFVLGRNGSLKNVESLSSCGHAFLDESATRAITEVSSFPPLPDEFMGTEATFTIDITFKLNAKRED